MDSYFFPVWFVPLYCKQMPLLTRLLNGDEGGGRAEGGNVNALFAELGEGFVRRMLEKFNESRSRLLQLMQVLH